MRDPVLLPIVALLAMSGAAPLLARRLGRNAGYPLALGFAAVAVWLIAWTPAVLRRQAPDLDWPWIPSLGLRFSARLDGLSLAFALLIVGIGALVLAYSARYLAPGGKHGRMYGLIVLFAASMFGLVVARDVILLFIFWELTSVTSFFLIAGEGNPQATSAANRALLVTGLGGLALFAGLVAMIAVTGTADLSLILADASSIRDHALAPAILALVLIGAFTKSAQFPFHFWLPGAMIAPTPVSTYLHAATMVKAGIYLLARLTPIFGETVSWRYAVVITGLVTAVLGAAFALKQYDLKALLAYSTVSTLGFIIALVGVGTAAALAAAIVTTIAHAAYKATLFMVVGIIDVEAGSRDLRRLSGLRRVMPRTAFVTGLAALSMAGIPPLLGFVSKEEAFAAFLGMPGAAWVGPVMATAAVLAAAITFAYGARIFDSAFEGPVVQRMYEPRTSFLAPAAVTAVAGLAMGAAAAVLDDLAGDVVEVALGVPEPVHFTLWHGFTGPLALSGTAIVGGLLLFFWRRRIDRRAVREPVRRINGEDLFDRAHAATVTAGRGVGRPFVTNTPARHLALVVAVAVGGATAAWFHFLPSRLPTPPTPVEDWAVVGLVALAMAGAVVARVRLGAVAVIGVAGFIVALVYVLLGAPDLAATQVLVETLTIVIVVLVFRRLAPRFHEVAVRRRALSAAVAIVVGTGAGLLTYSLTGRPDISGVGAYYLDAAPTEAGGNNVVNTILVDFRALDTFGEIIVLAVAALGMYALVRARRKPS